MWCNAALRWLRSFSRVSMPHAAFYVVQPRIQFPYNSEFTCFNAARSILCGATKHSKPLSTTFSFQCRTQHFMWCNKRRLEFQGNTSRSFNAARSILCGATLKEKTCRLYVHVSMPHAAFYVVQLRKENEENRSIVSMPHAAFYVVQQCISNADGEVGNVSMPHAAFYVVQQK